MADIKANPDIRKMQINIRISELALNIQRMNLRKIEISDEEARIEENLKATNKALDELKKELGE